MKLFNKKLISILIIANIVILIPQNVYALELETNENIQIENTDNANETYSEQSNSIENSQVIDEETEVYNQEDLNQYMEVETEALDYDNVYEKAYSLEYELEKLNSKICIASEFTVGNGTKISKDLQNNYSNEEEGSKNEKLSAIRVITASDHIKYSIQIGLDRNDDLETKSFQDILEKPLTGEMQKKGCYLIKLPDEILLESGKKYAVMITLESDTGDIILAKFSKNSTYENTEEDSNVKEDNEEAICTNDNLQDNTGIYIKKESDAQWGEIENYEYGIKCYTKDYLEDDNSEGTDMNDMEVNDDAITNITNNENNTNNELQQNLNNNVVIKNESTTANSLVNPLLAQLDKEADSNQEKDTMMIAHRGMSALAPENTIVAFEMASIYGYQGVEFDVFQTKDGKYVISHDSSVDRMTNGSGKISKMTLSQIRKLKIDSGNGIENYSNLKIPTLKEALECCKQYNLLPCIEIKKAKNVKGILDIIEKYGYTSSVKIISRKESILKAIRKINKNISLSLISNGDGIEAVNTAKKLKCNGINLKFDCLNQDVLAYANQSDINIAVWNVDTVSDIDKAKNYEIDNITTNGMIYSNNLENLSLDNNRQIIDNYNNLITNSNSLEHIDSIEKCLTKENTWYEENNVNTANVGYHTIYQYKMVDEEIEKGSVIIITAQINSILGNHPYFTVYKGEEAAEKVGDSDYTTGWQTVKLVYAVNRTSHLNILFGLNEKEAGIFRIRNIEVSKYSRYQVEGISMNESIIELNIGKTYNMQENIQFINSKVVTTWKSSKNKVATVSALGCIKAKKTGKTNIYVTTDNGSKSKCTVIVKPKKMVKVKASNRTSHTVKIAWSKISSVSGYEIYGKKSGDKGYKLVKNIKKASKTSVKIKKLKTNKNYYYKIRAYITVDGKKYYGKFSKVTKVKS